LAEAFRDPPASSGLAALGWTGGGGARYLTLVEWERGAGLPDGTGGAGDLNDLRLGPTDPGEAGDPEGGWTSRGPGEDWSAWGEAWDGGPLTGAASP